MLKIFVYITFERTHIRIYTLVGLPYVSTLHMVVL